MVISEKQQLSFNVIEYALKKISCPEHFNYLLLLLRNPEVLSQSVNSILKYFRVCQLCNQKLFQILKNGWLEHQLLQSNVFEVLFISLLNFEISDYSQETFLRVPLLVRRLDALSFQKENGDSHKIN